MNSPACDRRPRADRRRRRPSGSRRVASAARWLLLACCLAAQLCASRTLALQSSNSNNHQQQQQQKSSTITIASTSPVPPATSTQETAPSDKNQDTKQRQSSLQQECQYEKSPWSECQPNGEQTRTLRLIKDERSGAGGARRAQKCPKARLVRRECKQGCKYTRGEWSADCVNGQRVRIDTLVGRVEAPSSSHSTSAAANKQQRGINCEPQRKVTKDCRRACHYVKSAWSECVNGFRTRDLRLEELAGAAPSETPSSCAKHRQIKRECNSRTLTTAKTQEASKPTTATATATATTTSSSQQTKPSAATQPAGSSQKLTLAQKRRLKQLQRQQQKQQQQQQPPAAAQTHSNNNKSI